MCKIISLHDCPIIHSNQTTEHPASYALLHLKYNIYYMHVCHSIYYIACQVLIVLFFMLLYLGISKDLLAVEPFTNTSKEQKAHSSKDLYLLAKVDVVYLATKLCV